MLKRAIYEITNISKINNLPTDSSFEDCLCCILEQDFKYNKYITPDTLQILKKNFKDFKLNFKNDYFFVNNNKYEISYQLKCEYKLLRCLQKNLKGIDTKLYNYFFESDNKFGIISKNIKVEVTKPGVFDTNNRYRVDLELTLENGYKIIFEVNENAHEDDGKRYKDIVRARQIMDDYKEILKFYNIREKFIENNYKKMNKFVKSKLIPFIRDISLLHNEKEYVVNKLVQLTHEEWKPLCESIYNSHLQPNVAFIGVNILIDFFDCDWIDKYKEEVYKIVRYNNSSIIDEQSDNNSDIDDLLSDVDDLLSDTNLEEDTSHEKEAISNYYEIVDNDVKLTWLGFNTYLTYIIKYSNNIKTEDKINKFRFKVMTEFINVLKQQRNEVLNFSQSNRIWGFIDKDWDLY